MRKTSVTTKESLKYLGSLSALFAATGTANAAIIKSPTVGAGLTPPAANGSIYWDVDNDGNNDFGLGNFASVGGILLANPYVTGNGAVALNSQAFSWAALPASFSVGPALNTGYTFKAATVVINGAFTVNSAIYAGAEAAGFALNTPSYIGFVFQTSGQNHFGWATLTPKAGPAGQGFTISEAYYEDVANTPIQTGAVPEPETAAVGLAALALGAAGLRRWRKQRAA